MANPGESLPNDLIRSSGHDFERPDPSCQIAVTFLKTSGIKWIFEFHMIVFAWMYFDMKDFQLNSKLQETKVSPSIAYRSHTVEIACGWDYFHKEATYLVKKDCFPIGCMDVHSFKHTQASRRSLVQQFTTGTQEAAESGKLNPVQHRNSPPRPWKHQHEMQPQEGVIGHQGSPALGRRYRRYSPMGRRFRRFKSHTPGWGTASFLQLSCNVLELTYTTLMLLGIGIQLITS